MGHNILEYKEPELKLKKFIKIPNTDGGMISLREQFIGECLDWRDSYWKIKELSDKIDNYELSGTSVHLFVEHLVNLRKAIDNKGKGLYYGDGSRVGTSEAYDIHNALLSGKCATWLYDRFFELNGKLYLETDFRINENGLMIPETRKILENCVKEDCLIDFEFNEDGYPIRKFKMERDIENHHTLYRFLYPSESCVAVFTSFEPDCTVVNTLNCRANPRCNTNSSNGAFVYAQKN